MSMLDSTCLVRAVKAGLFGDGWSPSSFGSTLEGWWKKGVGRFESADESDPADTNGNAVRRWSDQSGVGNHFLQSTANVRPARYDDRVAFFWKTDGADLQANLGLTLASPLARDNFSGGCVFDAPCSNAAPLVALDDFAIQSGRAGTSAHLVYYFDGASILSTGLPSSGKRMRIVWSNTSAGLKIMVNGVLASLTALTADALTVMTIGMYTGGLPKPSRAVECFLSSRAMTAGEMTSADAYLLGVAGPLGASGKVIAFGDSMTAGCGSDLCLPWVYRTTNRETSHEWRIFGHNGAGLWSAIRVVSDAQIAGMVSSSADVVVAWAGTNDIITFGRTGAQAFADLDALRVAVQATGAKFIAATLQAFAANNAERVAFNALLVAAAGSYDAVVSLHTAPELDDSTDTTYYTDDGVHFKDAGHAAAAALFQAAMASV